MQDGGQAISYLKKLSDYRFQIIYTFAICGAFFIEYLIAAPDKNLLVLLVLCQPVYVIIANKYCPRIRKLVLAFTTVGFLLWLLQILRGEELHPDALTLFFLIFVMPASLILIGIGLYIWLRERRLSKRPDIRKFIDGAFGLAIVAVVIIIASNPLRQSEEDIEKDLLVEIPIGTPMEEVRLHFIKDESVLATERTGIVDLGDGKYWQKRKFEWDLNDTGIQENREDGGLYFESGLGEYQGFPWVTWVRVDLVFGADGKLKYLHVWKMQDAL